MKTLRHKEACTLSYNEAIKIQAAHVKTFAEAHNLTPDQTRKLQTKVDEQTETAADVYNIYGYEATDELPINFFRTVVPRGKEIDKIASEIKAAANQINASRYDDVRLEDPDMRDLLVEDGQMEENELTTGLA